ncbi:hypothetical protein OURE66S_00208 [Oligella ureolytica]
MFKLRYLSALIGCHLLLGGQLVYAQSVEAADESDVVNLETLNIVSEREYDAIVTENTRDYSSYAATVGLTAGSCASNSTVYQYHYECSNS